MFEHKALYMVTNRLAEGLPLVANEHINTVIYGVLARAQEAFPEIEIDNFQFMGNHYHGFIVTRGDPQDVAKFLNILDGELAKIIQRLLGRRNTLVWAQRAHVARILDYEAAIKQLVYAYLNPVAANLVDSIDDWRGVTSWGQLFTTAPIHALAVYPRHIRQLPNKPFRSKDARLYTEQLAATKKIRHLQLQLKPFGFKDCFAESCQLSDEQVRQHIVERVRDGEEQYRQLRIKEKRCVVGAKALAEQNPYMEFKPQKFGRRVICICTDPVLRLQYIEAYKAFCAVCEQAWATMKREASPRDYPPAAFIPARPPRANILPVPW